MSYRFAFEFLCRVTKQEMTSKSDLISEIIDELRKAQSEPWVPPPSGKVDKLRLPPSLPVQEGGQIAATDRLLEKARAYSRLWMENSPDLNARFKQNEFYKLVTEAFGEILNTVDLDKPTDMLTANVKTGVEKALHRRIAHHHKALELILGCHLFDGDAAYPMTVGPVRFETRDQCIERIERNGQISATTARRLRSHWNGRKPRKRKPSRESQREQALLKSIGDGRVACTITTDGLSLQMQKEKGLLAARMAMTAVSLMWVRPSEGLAWMNLLYDRRFFHRHYVIYGDDGYMSSGSTVSQMPSGHWTYEQLITHLARNQWLFDEVGEALWSYTDPSRITSRPLLMNAFLLSLWWFHEACRESSDQMATTKFAASMDALCGGGKSKGIIKLITARLGLQANDPAMKDGRTVKQIINHLYDQGRSRLTHGSSENFAHDWSETREISEIWARHSLVSVGSWLSKNKNVDDFALLLTP